MRKAYNLNKYIRLRNKSNEYKGIETVINGVSYNGLYVYSYN